jgi:hypothetical protein
MNETVKNEPGCVAGLERLVDPITHRNHQSGSPYVQTIDLLNEIAEFLENQSDVVDGSYGEPHPNRAMSLLALVDEHIEWLKRASPTATEERS